MKARLAAWILPGLLALSACAAVIDTSDFQQAVSSFKAADYPTAQLHAQKAYDSAPLIPKHGAILGWINLKLGRMDQAETLLAELKSYADAYVETIQLDSWLSYVKGDLDTAQAKFQAQLDWARIHRGRSYYPRKYFTKDVAFIEQIHWDAHHGLGLVAAARNNPDLAIQHLTVAALAQDYLSHLDALMALAALYLEQGNEAKTLDLLTGQSAQALQLAPVVLATRIQAADGCATRPILERAQQLYPQAAIYAGLMALAQASCGQGQAADQAMDRALDLAAYPVDFTLLARLAEKDSRIRAWLPAYGERLHERTRSGLASQFLTFAAPQDCRRHLMAAWADHGSGAATTALDRFARLESQGCGPKAEIITGQGLAQLALGRLDQAEQSLRRAIRADPGFGRAAVALGAVSYAGGNYAQAISRYRSSLHHLPDGEKVWSWGSHALHNLGWSHYWSGQFPQALAIFQSLGEYHPSPSAAALTGQGWSRLRLGEQDGALADFTQALTLDPGLILARQGHDLALSRTVLPPLATPVPVPVAAAAPAQSPALDPQAPQARALISLHRDQDGARRAWSSLNVGGILTPFHPHYQTVTIAGAGQVVRLYAEGDEAAVRRLCNDMHRQQMYCRLD